MLHCFLNVYVNMQDLPIHYINHKQDELKIKYIRDRYSESCLNGQNNKVPEKI